MHTKLGKLHQHSKSFRHILGNVEQGVAVAYGYQHGDKNHRGTGVVILLLYDGDYVNMIYVLVDYSSDKSTA